MAKKKDNQDQRDREFPMYRDNEPTYDPSQGYVGGEVCYDEDDYSENE